MEWQTVNKTKFRKRIVQEVTPHDEEVSKKLQRIMEDEEEDKKMRKTKYVDV